MLLPIDLWETSDFSQESLKGEGIIHTWKTVWLYFSNKQNDLLAEVWIMQYSKSWGWILFPVKWSMKRRNLCLYSRQWECIHIQAIAQLPANRSQSALWTSRAAFKERSSTIWTKWLATSFLLFHHLHSLSQEAAEDSEKVTLFRDMCVCWPTFPSALEKVGSFGPQKGRHDLTLLMKFSEQLYQEEMHSYCNSCILGQKWSREQPFIMQHG